MTKYVWLGVATMFLVFAFGSFLVQDFVQLKLNVIIGMLFLILTYLADMQEQINDQR